jgi:hypothetical protein
VSIYIVFDGERKLLAGPVEFEAKTLKNSTLPVEDPKDLVAFQKQVTELTRVMDGMERYGRSLEKRIVAVRQTIHNTPSIPAEVGESLKTLSEELDDMYFTFNGPDVKASWEEVPPAIMPLNNRFQYIAWGMWGSTSEPTQTMKDNYAILVEEVPSLLNKLKEINEQLLVVEKKLDQYDAPWTPGRIPEFRK